MLNISYNLKPLSERRTEPFVPTGSIGFGNLRTDHMFLMDFNHQDGWHDAKIIPYGPIPVMPGAGVFQYGSSVFEGAKAFQHNDGEIYTFRYEQNISRINKSAKKILIEQIPKEIQIKALESLINIDRLHFPQKENSSLYIRPFLMGLGDQLGVGKCKKFKYCVFLSPSGPYYGDQIEPISLMITNQFKRVAPKSVGKSKTGGNYAASLRAVEYAKEFDCKQVLYTDTNDRFIEEAGAMNHYHVTMENEIIIPTFTDTILESITSRSIIELSQKGLLKYPVRQEMVTLESFIEDVKSGYITEAGGLGTAAAVSPVGNYVLDHIEDKSNNKERIIVGDGSIGPITQQMYDLLTGIQYGRIKGPEGWLKKVKKNNE